MVKLSQKDRVKLVEPNLEGPKGEVVYVNFKVGVSRIV